MKGKGKRRLLIIVLTLVVGLVYFYFALPAINLQSPDFYGFFFLMALVYTVLTLLFSGGVSEASTPGDYLKLIRSSALVPALCCLALIAIYLVGSLISSPILRAKSYAEVLTVDSGDFATEVDEVAYDTIPMLDQESATRLGNRKLGELSDMVSQFEVVNSYSQINYNGTPVRVTTLKYGDVIKWFNNQSDGLPAYIVIDMVTQNAEVVRLSDLGLDGIKYSTYDYFFRNLDRHLRFSYPTYMFGDPVFEIDDDGVPYWVCPRIVRTVGLFGGTDINGAVLVNAITGEHEYYDSEDVPNWVDRVFSSDLLIEQYDWYGAYESGLLNSIFGQRGVTETTDGYNYIAMDDDVYMYTGITSVGGDASNIGFILSNQRTKETTFYSAAGAEEYSAMGSAQGLVQDLGYSATFPLLLNVSGQPTYFMALKDSSDLVKQYAMVNVQYYQIAANAETVAECEAKYKELLLTQDIVQAEQLVETSDSGVIEEILSAVIEGNSYYYIRLEDEDFYYVISAAEDQNVVTLAEGDRVEVLHSGTGGDLVVAYSIKKT